MYVYMYVHTYMYICICYGVLSVELILLFCIASNVRL